MNKFRIFAQQSFVYGLSSILPRFLIFLLNPLYSYNFPIADIGIVTILYSSVIFIQVFLTFGLETGFFYFSQSKNIPIRLVYGTAFNTVLFFTALFCLFGLFYPGILASFLKLEQYQSYIRYILLIVSIDIVCSIPFAWLRYHNRAIRFAIIKMINVLVNFFLSILLIFVIPRFFLSSNHTFCGFPFTKSIELIFIANLIAGIVMFIVLLKDIYPAFLQFSWRLFKNLMAYSLPIMLAGLIVTLHDISDRYLLLYFLPSSLNGTVELGIYGANIKLAVLMAIFVQVFKLTAEPYIFKLNTTIDASKLQSIMLKYFALYGCIIFLFVMAFVDVFKYFVGPSDYWVGLPVIPVYLMANLFMGLYFNLSYWYKLSNKTWLGILITFAGLFVSIGLSVLFIPRFSYFVCAWSHLAGYLVMVGISYYLGLRFSPIRFNLRPVFIYILVTLFAFCIIYFVRIDYYFLNLAKNACVLLLFLIYLEKKEKIFSIFYQNVNQSFE